MGWLGKVVCGTIGFAVGGPLGAAVGIGIGHASDEIQDSQNTNAQAAPAAPAAQPQAQFNAECTFLRDDIGIGLQFQVAAPAYHRLLAIINMYDGNGNYLKGRSPFVDNDGDFSNVSEIEEGTTTIYIPFGAVNYPAASDYVLGFRLFGFVENSDDPVPLGQELFNFDFPAPPVYGPVYWNRCEWMHPLIELCMHVVHADGKVLPEEVKLVKEFFTNVFELGQQDKQDLKQAMKQVLRPNYSEIIDSIRLRMPKLNMIEILCFLSDISKCDGEVHPKEIEVIREIALTLGVEPGDWDEIALQLGLIDPQGEAPRASGGVMSMEQACCVLGVSVNASRAEILAAHRKLVSDYHPDRVANLPKEFQEVAHNKMVEINAAYEVLGRGKG